MGWSSREMMARLLKMLSIVLLFIACLFLFNTATSVLALIDIGMDSKLPSFLVNQCITGMLAAIPLLIFIRFVQAAVRSGEFFSHSQSKRILLIAACFLLRVINELFAPRIEIPGMFDGAVGSTSVGPTLNLTTLALSLMFFALAGVFEYGRKLQEESDNIL